ncbi:hypothetical protein Lal_00018550 [Lupinus albus]|nr:hypothetical protein Lal_00018550 [Lupinus albus]
MGYMILNHNFDTHVVLMAKARDDFSPDRFLTKKWSVFLNNTLAFSIWLTNDVTTTGSLQSLGVPLLPGRLLMLVRNTRTTYLKQPARVIDNLETMLEIQDSSGILGATFKAKIIKRAWPFSTGSMCQKGVNTCQLYLDISSGGLGGICKVHNFLEIMLHNAHLPVNHVKFGINIAIDDDALLSISVEFKITIRGAIDFCLSERVSPSERPSVLILGILGISPKRESGRLSERSLSRLSNGEGDGALCGPMELTQPKVREKTIVVLEYFIRVIFSDFPQESEHVNG